MIWIGLLIAAFLAVRVYGEQISDFVSSLSQGSSVSSGSNIAPGPAPQPTPNEVSKQATGDAPPLAGGNKAQD